MHATTVPCLHERVCTPGCVNSSYGDMCNIARMRGSEASTHPARRCFYMPVGERGTKCGLAWFNANQKPALTSSEGITRYPGPIATGDMWDCVAECTLDNRCVAIMMSKTANGTDTCTLLSVASGGLVDAENVTSRSLQSCLDAWGESWSNCPPRFPGPSDQRILIHISLPT